MGSAWRILKQIRPCCGAPHFARLASGTFPTRFGDDAASGDLEKLLQARPRRLVLSTAQRAKHSLCKPSVPAGLADAFSPAAPGPWRLVRGSRIATPFSRVLPVLRPDRPGWYDFIQEKLFRGARCWMDPLLTKYSRGRNASLQTGADALARASASQRRRAIRDEMRPRLNRGDGDWQFSHALVTDIGSERRLCPEHLRPLNPIFLV